VQRLAGLTTGNIAKALRTALSGITDSTVHAFVEAGADILGDLSSRRAHVLHARPATTPDGKQRLYRYRLLPDGRTEAFWIDDEFLDDFMAAITCGERHLEALRLRPERGSVG